MNAIFLTDQEVMTLLRISERTLRELLRNGPSCPEDIDLRKCEPIRVGTGQQHRQRRWSIGRFCEVSGMTREEVWMALK